MILNLLVFYWALCCCQIVIKLRIELLIDLIHPLGQKSLSSESSIIASDHGWWLNLLIQVDLMIRNIDVVKSYKSFPTLHRPPTRPCDIIININFPLVRTCGLI